MLLIGLNAVGLNAVRKLDSANEKKFRALYGSSPLDLAGIWNDLSNRLGKEEQDDKGMKAYLKAVHFLWAYPKNAQVLGSMFGDCERMSRGESVWRWVRRVAELKDSKIKWMESFKNPKEAIFIITVDGTDFCTWEPKHPTMPVSRKHCSHKYKHAALRYGIALSIFTGQCVWISDSYPGGVHNMAIFCEGLKHQIPSGKLVIANWG